jgi:hypothetical protein
MYSIVEITRKNIIYFVAGEKKSKKEQSGLVVTSPVRA